MAKIKLRGFFANRKDLTKQEPVFETTFTNVLDKKGRPVIENGKPKKIKETKVTMENIVKAFGIRVNNAVPPSHKMLR
jgi:hypothetical protein